jgi:Uma2 family endonuclease
MATAEPTPAPDTTPPALTISPSPPPVSSVLPPEWTLADLLSSLGGIPPERIRMVPAPGTATENDVTEADVHADRLCELVDGTLVQKTAGILESYLATQVACRLMAFLDKHDWGIVLGAGGTLKILPDQVRIPDVCFISWDRFPNRKLPPEPIPSLSPDLAIEVLSPSNTEAEMQRKLRDYFAAGVRLVWYIDPDARSARSYTAEDQCVEVTESQSLSGGDVVPGFKVPLSELFAKVGA